MNFDNSSQPVVPIDRSIGYHYSYGRKQLYGASSPARIYGPFPTSVPNRYFSQGKTLARLDDGPQTVEQLVEQGYFAAPTAGDVGEKLNGAWLSERVIRTPAGRVAAVHRAALAIVADSLKTG